MYEIEKLEQKKIFDIINRLDFFNNFSIAEKQTIGTFHAHIFVYQKEEYLIREGDDDSSFFILLAGTTRVTKGSSNPITIANLEAGEFFGEISFLTNSIRTSNVIANEEVIVIKVDKNMLENLNIHIREKIKDKIIEKLVARLDKMNEIFVKYFII